MIGSTRNLRVWAYRQPADLRKGFDGLVGLTTKEMGADPLSGDCFLFVGRPRRSAKVLVWDGTGLCIYHKRLERGRFAPLWSGGGRESGSREAGDEKTASQSVALTMSELALYLEGCALVARMALSPPRYVVGQSR